MWRQRCGTSVTFTPQSVNSAQSGNYATWRSSRVKRKTELLRPASKRKTFPLPFFARLLLNKGTVTKQSERQKRSGAQMWRAYRRGCRGSRQTCDTAGAAGKKGWVGNNRPATIRLSEADTKTWRTSRFRSLKENIWFITMKENIWFVNTLGLISFFLFSFFIT